MRLTSTLNDFYNSPNSVNSQCLAITFFRPTGSPPVEVNGIPIEDGDSLEIGQPDDCLDTSQYRITFPDGVSSSNACHVIRIVPAISF